MVKKLKYLLFLIPFIFITNVNAQILGTPLTSVDYVDSTNDQANAEIGTWWDTQYYVAPFRIGYFTSATAEANKIAFYWGGANLCSGQNLKISGQIGALYNFFNDNSYNFNFINNNQNMTCAIENQDPSRIGFTCVGPGGGPLYIALNQNSFSSRDNYEVGIRRDFDISCEVTNLQVMQQEIINTQNIINNQNSNTNQIIQNQDGNTQDIIDNQNSNTQDIIDNQNQNTQQQIESQKVCTIIDKNSILNDNMLINSGNGTSTSNSDSFGITDYINIFSSYIKVLNIRVGGGYNCFYDINKSPISCISNSELVVGSLNIPSNAYYFRASIHKSQNRPSFEVCKSGNQALTDSITSEDAPNTSTELDNLDSSLASDTPISDLITLPITLANVFINGIESSCSPVNLGSLYGTNLTLPCINLEQRLGTDLWSKIDILFSIFMCYNIGMLFITAFSGITSLRDDFDSLYQPKHADTGYQPKHGG